MEEDLLNLTQSTENRLSSALTKIIAVRHAESIANTQGIYQGQTYDTDLSELGKKQAEALALKAHGVGINKIISSPLRRTYQTALEVSRICDCPVEINDLIIETNHGEWEGKDKESVRQMYPDIYATWQTRPSQAVFPGGEAFIQMQDRIETFLESAELTDNTLIVTHDNVVRLLVTLANGWTLDDIWTHAIEPAALNYFEANKVDGKTKLTIIELNHSDHLTDLKSDLTNHAL